MSKVTDWCAEARIFLNFGDLILFRIWIFEFRIWLLRRLIGCPQTHQLRLLRRYSRKHPVASPLYEQENTLFILCLCYLLHQAMNILDRLPICFADHIASLDARVVCRTSGLNLSNHDACGILQRRVPELCQG